MGAPDMRATSRRGPLLAQVVGGAVLLLLGVAAGRMTVTGSGPADQPTSQPSTEGASHGPQRLEDGVPVGFERSESGAVAAATAYTLALDGAAAFDSSERERMLETLAAADDRERIADELRVGTDTMVEALALTAETLRDPGFVAYPVAAGYRVRFFDADRATVDVWGTSILSVPDRQTLRMGWTTVTVDLRWERGDWRLTGRSSRIGPEPPVPPAPGDPAVGAQINGFERYLHASAPN